MVPFGESSEAGAPPQPGLQLLWCPRASQGGTLLLPAQPLVPAKRAEPWPQAQEHHSGWEGNRRVPHVQDTLVTVQGLLPSWPTQRRPSQCCGFCSDLSKVFAVYSLGFTGSPQPTRLPLRL